MYCDSKRSLEIGSLGKVELDKGYYAYIGSALSGLHRVKRHLENIERKKEDNNTYWHIDYITPWVEFKDVFFCEDKRREIEEKIAFYLAEVLDYVLDFGSSDTGAPSHLFFSSSYESILNEIENIKEKKDIDFKSLMEKKGGENVLKTKF